MWGGNGKNHTWSMGHHWLVALFVLPATIVYADFMSHDSQNLQQIRYVLLGSGTTDGDSIWALTLQQKAILNSVDSKVSSVSTISSDLVTIKQYLDYNLNGDSATDSMSLHDFIQEFNRKFFKGVDRYDRTVVANPATVSIFSPNGISPFVEPGKSFQNRYTSQMAVTNIAETYWLEKIYNRLAVGTSLSGLTLWPSVNGSGHINYYPDIDTAYQDIQDLLADPDNHAYLLSDYGIWRLFAQMYLSTINLNTIGIQDQGFKEKLRDYYNQILGYYDYDTFTFFSYAFESIYGTALLTLQSTNTCYSGLDVNNFFTNGVALSLYATNAFQRVAESSGINTNEMYLGSYGSETNSDVFADIITNGVELLEGNQVYSSLGEDVDAASLSNKVSMFNFTAKFDDSIKPFLDEIENASGGDWIINFGNVDLGDHFSFTIPALTVQRNETFLRYVDKFLNVLKIILTFAFFLILWHQLEHAVEST